MERASIMTDGTAAPEPPARDPLSRAARTRLEEQLAALRPKELRELAQRHGVTLRETRRKADIVAALLGSPAADALQRELRGSADREANLLRDELAATRDAVRESANLGAAVGAAEDDWNAAAHLLEDGDIEGARHKVAAAARRATEARERRIREIEEALHAVDDHIVQARNVGADVAEAERLLAEAGLAAEAREYGRADDLVKRAERAAMESQQRQIQRAIELRETQMERSQAIIASCEPLILEAEAYGLNPSDVRTLLRQARDVLAKGDYVSAFQFARNAEEATYRLEAHVEEERRRRGIMRPRAGACAACGSEQLTFYDDGWGQCGKCGSTFRWRLPRGVRERVRGLLGT